MGRKMNIFEIAIAGLLTALLDAEAEALPAPSSVLFIGLEMRLGMNIEQYNVLLRGMIDSGKVRMMHDCVVLTDEGRALARRLNDAMKKAEKD